MYDVLRDACTYDVFEFCLVIIVLLFLVLVLVLVLVAFAVHLPYKTRILCISCLSKRGVNAAFGLRFLCRIESNRIELNRI